MPSSIFGTYPIVSHQSAQRDEYGIESKSWVFTVKTTDLSAYLPSKDAAYAGPGVTPPVTNPYRVTQASSQNKGGDLSEISVTAVGSQFNLPPVISLISGCPFIFGLTGGPGVASNTGLGYGSSGFGVQASFVIPATNSSENQTLGAYLFKPMPEKLLGAVMPTPARAPFLQEFFNTIQGGQFPGGEYQRKSGEIRYQGYLADEVTFRRDGGASLVNIIYREKGYLYYLEWSGNTGTANYVYNFVLN